MLGGVPAAFGRLCVETDLIFTASSLQNQPPSGGCVLKPVRRNPETRPSRPAAFRRLCVETTSLLIIAAYGGCPAAFRRLCVETPYRRVQKKSIRQPPSGGCVLKPRHIRANTKHLCQPPSGGCVLKP